MTQYTVINLSLPCQAGACIVSSDNKVVSVGYNGTLQQGKLSEEKIFQLVKQHDNKTQGAPDGKYVIKQRF